MKGIGVPRAARILASLAIAPALLLGACVPLKPGASSGSVARPVVAPALAEPGSAADRYDALIAHYAAENGVPLPLAHAVVRKESGYNARATGRGTLGLMQIKPATARGIGYRGSNSGLYDPATNLEWGMKYLGGAYRLGGGDICGTALRYQGGHRATRQTAATRRYCADLKAKMADYQRN